MQFSPDAPLILWLQGGPGGSSLFGLFIEHGPFYVTEQLDIRPRSTAWSLPYNVLYIDQPAGTGFSFTKSDLGYVTDQERVADDLYEALKQFYTLFPTLLSQDLYIAGESYAGKYDDVGIAAATGLLEYNLISVAFSVPKLFPKERRSHFDAAAV